MDDIFQRIITRDIPADVVYEDSATLAFLDIHPTNPGHTLIVPKEKARDIFTVSEEAFLAIARAARKIAPALVEAVRARGLNIVVNNKSAAGQIVPHLHMHLIPRFDNDGLHPWPAKEYAPHEAKKIAEKIRAALGEESTAQ